MLACEIHGAKDLRVAERSADALAPTQGRVGDFVIREPFTPGHEASGQVIETGAEVSTVRPGDRVAINPSRTCGGCRFCRAGAFNHCENVHFFGSASRFPHMQGAMRESMVVDQRQCLPVPASLPFEIAAFGEPLAVALHAVNQAGSLLGMTLMAARLAGARELIAVDIVDQTLAACARVGATCTIHAGRDPAALDALAQAKGLVDVCFEVSGSYAGLANCIRVTRPCGTIVQVGTLSGSSEGCPFNQIMVKSLSLIGAFRFTDEYEWAVDYLSRKVIDVSPLLTEALPVARVHEAFALAGDRTRAMKVQVTF
jgi:L-idonate 5-dehydrogenase